MQETIESPKEWLRACLDNSTLDIHIKWRENALPEILCNQINSAAIMNKDQMGELKDAIYRLVKTFPTMTSKEKVSLVANLAATQISAWVNGCRG